MGAGAGAGAESWSFVKFMLNFFRAGAEKSAIQLNGIAQGRETTYKALLLMLILRKG